MPPTVGGNVAMFSSEEVNEYTLRGTDTSSNRRITFNPFPATARDIWYEYTKTITELAADADTNLVPTKYEHILVYGGMGFWYQHKGDDTRFSITKQDAAAILQTMLKEVDAHDQGDVQFKLNQSAKAWAMAGMLYRPSVARLTMRQTA
jgi:hypothetical protein